MAKKGAGARGKDSPYGRQHRGRRRRVVYVYTEGSLTEPSYIDALTALRSRAREERPLPASAVESAIEIMWDERTHGGTRGPKKGGYDRKPLDLVEAAVRLKKQKKRESSGQPKKYQPDVWVLFDRDDHPHVRKAATLARNEGIHVAYSHPCFELWRLLHYQDFTSTFGGECEDASVRLRSHKDFVATYGGGRTKLTEDQAKLVLVGQVEQRYARAKKFAVRMNRQHNTGEYDQLEKWDPYTDVWRFVEEAVGLDDY